MNRKFYFYGDVDVCYSIQVQMYKYMFIIKVLFSMETYVKEMYNNLGKSWSYQNCYNKVNFLRTSLCVRIRYIFGSYRLNEQIFSTLRVYLTVSIFEWLF